MTNPLITIVIPNWNGKSLLEKNLPAVIKAVHGAQIIVVDDASKDDSVAFLKHTYPQVTVVTRSTQGGFASSVNDGVSSANGEIVILLNTDVRPKEDFLPPLLAHFSRQEVFGVGCLDRSHEHGAVVNRGRGMASWQRGFYVHRRGEINAQDTAWVSGGSGAFRKDIWIKLGGMDTMYNPFYWEDIDLSYRARKAGYVVLFDRNSVVDHMHEEGAIQSEYTKYTIERIAFRNQYLFVWKNLSDPRLWVAHIFWNKIALLKALLSGKFAMVSGYADALFKLPIVVLRRSKARKFWKLADRVL